MRHGSTRTWICALLLLGGAVARAGDGAPKDPLDARLGVRTAPLLLLSRADVQADLAMSPEQIAGAEHAIRELHARAEALRGRPNTPEVVAGARPLTRASAAG